MKCLSRKDIEDISIRVFSAYKQLPSVKERPLHRVEPELLVKDLLNLYIDYEHLSLDGMTLGLTAFEEVGVEVYDVSDTPFMYILDGKTILIERDLKECLSLKGRCNFSILHEGSHQILKMLFPNDYGIPTKESPPVLKFYKPSTAYRIRDWEEWQANNLASAIMLPRELVEQAMYYFGFPEHIKIVNRIIYNEEYARFASMAEFLGASKKALAIRMKKLGLLDKEYLDRPYEILNIEVD